MPEWEERKSLLAQRRVESVRLLTVLLNRVKLASQKVDPSLDVKKDDSFSETAFKDTQQELINSLYCTHKELKCKEFKCPLTQKGSGLCCEEGDVSNFHAPTCHIVRTILNDPSPAPSADGLPGRDVCDSSARGCGPLLITVTQDGRVIKPLRGRHHPPLDVVHTQTVSEEDDCKKQKVYETDEFIHYLLNYYQTPHYARVCLEPKTTANKSRWKRVVSDDGSGFDISLSNEHGQQFREVSPVQNFHKRNCSGDSNYRLVITLGEIETKDKVLESKVLGGKLAKKLQVQRNDSVDNLTHAGLNHSLECTTVTHNKEFKKEDGRDEGTVPYGTCRPACRLKDLLEEISDSEYFREACVGSVKRAEGRYEEIYSSCNKGCLSAKARERKLLAYHKNVAVEGQEKEISQCNSCFNSVHEGLARQCEPKLKKSYKRSSSKLRYEEKKSERQSREKEKNAHKMKKKQKKLSSNLLSDECGFSEMDSCMQLESLRKIQRKCKKMLHKKVKFKTHHTSMAASDVTPYDGLPLQDTFQRRGEREGHHS
ncbi:hypothetical protein DUI87_15154 [Hirundo rustica rustica]|uniref:A-kinase anchor protein 17B n=1 Tax=Hirundo rustica rustica TaxID=333673 RepID=A0A3M0K4L8_HIRRU|nr:hypothetical protein DUI87_15154 [Hirundo rustica rustica]